MSEDHLSIRSEADRIQRACLRSRADGRMQLGSLLDRAHRLGGAERTEALDFNARLVTELRIRRVPIWGEQ